MASLHKARQALFSFLEENGIDYKTHTHPPVFTVEESRSIKADLPGAHTKNLFLKDKAGALFLICAEAQTQIAINKLHKVLGCKRLSFGTAEQMENCLGVSPGSVTLFGLINDMPTDRSEGRGEEKGTRVTLILDKRLTQYDRVNFHPLKNDATTAISAQNMIRFATLTGHTPLIMDFSQLGSTQ